MKGVDFRIIVAMILLVVAILVIILALSGVWDFKLTEVFKI